MKIPVKLGYTKESELELCETEFLVLFNYTIFIVLMPLTLRNNFISLVSLSIPTAQILLT